MDRPLIFQPFGTLLSPQNRQEVYRLQVKNQPGVDDYYYYYYYLLAWPAGLALPWPAWYRSRGKGYGKHFMQWALEKCAMIPRSQCAWMLGLQILHWLAIEITDFSQARCCTNPFVFQMTHWFLIQFFWIWKKTAQEQAWTSKRTISH